MIQRRINDVFAVDMESLSYPKMYLFVNTARPLKYPSLRLLIQYSSGKNWQCFLVDSSKYKTFVQHLYNVGPTSSTLGRRCINVVQMFCVLVLSVQARDTSREKMAIAPQNNMIKGDLSPLIWYE